VNVSLILIGATTAEDCPLGYYCPEAALYPYECPEG